MLFEYLVAFISLKRKDLTNFKVISNVFFFFSEKKTHLGINRRHPLKLINPYEPAIGFTSLRDIFKIRFCSSKRLCSFFKQKTQVGQTIRSISYQNLRGAALRGKNPNEK